MKPTRLLLLLAATVLAQRGPIRPDGITKRTETHRFDLSSCDSVEISGPVRDLTVVTGTFKAFWFKKFADISQLSITCEIER